MVVRAVEPDSDEVDDDGAVVIDVGSEVEPFDRDSVGGASGFGWQGAFYLFGRRQAEARGPPHRRLTLVTPEPSHYFQPN